MNSSDIAALWQRDTDIDMTELGAESTKVPQLHGKYLSLLVSAQSEERQARRQVQVLTRIKSEYYMGTLDKRSLDKFGWAPFLKKVIKTELPLYLESDEDLQKLQAELMEATSKTKMLEEILRSLNGRGYLIKNAIDWIRFQQGSM